MIQTHELWLGLESHELFILQNARYLNDMRLNMIIIIKVKQFTCGLFSQLTRGIACRPPIKLAKKLHSFYILQNAYNSEPVCGRSYKSPGSSCTCRSVFYCRITNWHYLKTNLTVQNVRSRTVGPVVSVLTYWRPPMAFGFRHALCSSSSEV